MASNSGTTGKMSNNSRRKFIETMIAGISENSQDDSMADVDIIVEDEKFPCHRLILATMSPYFKAMFHSGMVETRERSITIPGISKSAFVQVRASMYGSDYNITADNALELLHAAALFQIIPLQEACEEFLAKEMDMENCLMLFKVARSCNCKVLLERCRPFVMEGFNGLWKSDEFETLDLEDLESIVRDDDLVPVDEEQICEATLKWVEADLVNRKEYLGRLFRHIRLVNVSPEYLLEELYNKELLLNDENCKRYLDEVRDYHILPARRHEFASGRFHLRNSDDFEEVILALTEYDMERSGSFYQDGKCLWAYSHHQGRWYTLAPIPLQQNPGTDFSVVSFRNDLYLTGGTSTLKNLLKYDSDRNEWAQCDANMKRGRYNHMMAAVRESVYVLGGYNAKMAEGNNVQGSIEEYNVNSRRWRTMGELITSVQCAATVAIGEKIYILGGKQEDGSHYDGIQIFDTRQRETKVQAGILKGLAQPLRVIPVDGKVIIITATGEVYDYRYSKVKLSLVKRLHHDCLPILGVAHYRGYIMLLSASKDKPLVFSKLFRLELRCSPTRLDVVSPKNNTKPKPIHACLRGIVNKQFLYHTYFQ
ncbi:kelch-like protein 24 [Mizuhopecten yessoensis]|uniref:kelch-like protein 24 n=1 Tax=Mizuhopecten yessoensis TaxID=6573 RepID=UPI000B45C045|nr:kelch-like protein 24 [Mizuhopecten yessoensis]XP_021358070.1 kelch-like protein 24 [Mizuhopecten yessoensis]XP_021358071.1 kelch-like protein 24 [Mizuhopecten yessoensis]